MPKERRRTYARRSYEPKGSTTSFRTKWFEITGKRTAEIITIITLVVGAVMAWILFQHMTDTKENSRELIIWMKEMVIAQRESTCTFRAPQDQRDTPANIAKCVWEAKRP